MPLSRYRRFRLLAPMILILIIAGALGLERMMARSRAYRLRAEYYYEEWRLYIEVVSSSNNKSLLMLRSAEARAAKASREIEKAEQRRAEIERIDPQRLAPHERSSNERTLEVVFAICDAARIELKMAEDERIEAARYSRGSAYCSRLADFNKLLNLKYERAASMPWILVAEDPAEPTRDPE